MGGYVVMRLIDRWPAPLFTESSYAVRPSQPCRVLARAAEAVLLAEQWDTHQPIFSASSTMIPAGPRT
jgi:hypothetical protein